MSLNKQTRRNKIRKRIRSKIFGQPNQPRLSVFRSNKEIYAQVIDDVNGNTIAAVSSQGTSGTNIEKASTVGKLIAEKLISTGISNVVFDRGGYLYHGRVKALAEGARKAGLKI